MTAQQLDAIVRVAGITLLLLMAMLLVREARSRRLAVAFLPFAICLSGFLIGNTPDLSLRLNGVVAAAAHLASGYTVVFLWWFCLTLFDQTFKPIGGVLAAGMAWLVLASADRGLFGPNIADKGLSWVLVALGFGMIAHLAWRLIRDHRGDLVESRRDARILLVVSLAGLLFIELAKEVVFGFEWRPQAYTIIENAGFLAFALWMLTLVLRANTQPLATRARAAFASLNAPPVPKIGETEGEARLAEQVRKLMEVERLYLDPDLTFDAFVQRTGASERAVRHFINHRLGYDHFRAFLNAYRVAEARRLLVDPSRSDKLIAIALDSGFASLASFNRVFRAIEGCAPSVYRSESGLDRNRITTPFRARNRS